MIATVQGHSQAGFSELLLLMDLLCLNGDGLGHLNLFDACCGWLDAMIAGNQLDESTDLLLSYITSVLSTFKPNDAGLCDSLEALFDNSPRPDHEEEEDRKGCDFGQQEPAKAQILANDFAEVDLNSKLCTFTVGAAFLSS